MAKGQPGAKEKAPAPGTKPELSGGGTPSSPGKEPDAVSKNLPGGPPPELEKKKIAVADAADRWGDLPIQAREVFRNSSNSDLPAEYVDWIDAYYKKLNRLK